MKSRIVALLAGLVFVSAQVLAQAPAPVNPYLTPSPYPASPVSLPFPFPFPLPTLPGLTPFGQSAQPARPYQMSRMVTKQEKASMMRMIMPLMTLSGMSVRDVMNLMATKYKAKPGLSFDDVVESMHLRANKLNFKLVGHSPMWKDFQAVLGDTMAPRIEVFHYCDIAAGREVLKMAPESLVYLPCRIGVMEDADKNIWVMTLDWDMAWLDSINASAGISAELAKMAVDIRDKMDNIMQAGANGDL